MRFFPFRKKFEYSTSFEFFRRKGKIWKKFQNLSIFLFNRHTVVMFYRVFLIKNTNKCSDFI